jgi:Domain of unknown function (DUF4440)
MKTTIIGLFLLTMVQFSFAQQPPTETITTATKNTPEQEQIIKLSEQKWQWMANKDVKTLNNLFDEKAMFVHMGGTWGKTPELKTIEEGGIWYKKAEVYSVVVNIFGDTAVLFNDIDLVAVVGGNEVVNPFMVTEVYVKTNGTWKMASLTFSHLRRPVKLNTNSDKN